MFGFLNSLFGNKQKQEVVVGPGVTITADTLPKTVGGRKRKSKHKRQKKKRTAKKKSSK